VFNIRVIACLMALFSVSACSGAGSPTDQSDCSEPATVNGTLSNAIGTIDFTGAEWSVSVSHKLDVDDFEDRCIAHLEATLTVMGQGCRLHMVFGVEEGRSALRLNEAVLRADSFCSGWSDDNEGDYIYLGEGTVSAWLPPKVPDAVAQTSCFFADIAFEDQATLERADGQSLFANFSQLALSGDFLSTGDTGLQCPELPTSNEPRPGPDTSSPPGTTEDAGTGGPIVPAPN
jgi:hypothetical protein